MTRALAILCAVLACAVARAQPVETVVAPGGFTGGTLTAPLILDATNTLCTQALSLSFNGDSNLGLQRNAADALLLCAEAVTIPSTLNANHQLTVSVTNGGASTSATIAALSNDGNQWGAYLSSFTASYTGAPYLAQKSVLYTTPLTTELVLSAGDKVTIAPGSNGYPSSNANAALEVDIVSGSQTEVVINQAGSNDDTLRVEGDTDANLLCSDATNDRIGVGTCSPGDKLHVAGSVRVAGDAHLHFDGTAPSINGASTCTATGIDSGSTDALGMLNGTCTAGQTIVVDFANAWLAGGVVRCMLTPRDVDAVTDAFYISGLTTSALTIAAAVGSVNDAIVYYYCSQTR